MGRTGELGGEIPGAQSRAGPWKHVGSRQTGMQGEDTTNNAKVQRGLAREGCRRQHGGQGGQDSGLAFG